MKRAFAIFLVLTMAMSSFSQGWRPNEMEVKVFLTSGQDLQALTAITRNIEPGAADGSVCRAYLVPSELEQLRSTTLKYEVVIADLNRHFEHFWDNPLVPPGYYTYEQIIAIADSLATNFPGICKKESWGTSLGNRQLAALKISDNVNIDEAEAEIMYDGGIHGDEVGGSQDVIMFARDLCLSYGSDPTITDLVDNREIWLYLMVNPDGRASMSRYNNNGVDCNRDNGYMWDGEGFSPSAFSQVETKALRNGIQNNQFVVYTNFHSGTEIISYPWSYRSDNPRDFQHINQLASVYSSSSGYAGGLQYGQGYNVMYAINGSTKDFQYGSLGNIGWSIEISMDKQPPSSQVQHFYNVNKPAMLEVINRCGWGVSGLVTDSLSGIAVRATVWVNDYFPVYTDPVLGDYFKYILPGTYSVKVTANGYKPKTITGVVVPSQGTVQTDFQLVPDTGWYAYKVMSCRIPGNNFGDEGYTPGCIGSVNSNPYAIGRNGWVILDMGDTLYDGPGVDFKVFQSGTTQKTFTVSGSNSQDGPFTTIGTGTGTSTFDIGSTGLGRIRYIQVKDNGAGPASGIGAGYNLDAIAMITPPLKVNFIASTQAPCAGTAVSFTDQSAGNPVSWTWSFPGAIPSTSSQQNPTGIVYPNAGNFSVALTISNGVSSLGKTLVNYITVQPSPFVALGNDTLVCDRDNVVLHAGNPGCSYFWSTGATTESIVVDSAGTGYGTAIRWVAVTGLNGCTTNDSIGVTFDNCTSATSLALIPRLIVRPNPAKDHLIVRATDMNIHTCRLISSLGQVVREIDLNGCIDTSVDISRLPEGIYLLTATCKDGNWLTCKIVKW